MSSNARSQVRLLAVDVCDELFMRSKAFRDLVSPSFDRFLQLAVGYRSRDPLPGPADCAENLRTKALAAIQRWERAFGMHYPQVPHTRSTSSPPPQPPTLKDNCISKGGCCYCRCLSQHAHSVKIPPIFADFLWVPLPQGLPQVLVPGNRAVIGAAGAGGGSPEGEPSVVNIPQQQQQQQGPLFAPLLP